VTVELLEDTAAGKAGEKWILANARLSAMEPMIGKHRVVGTQTGSKLAGVEYEPMWEWLDEFAAPASGSKKQTACFVIVDPYVTTEDGTGLVHLAYYGEDDFRILRKNGIPLVLTVDAAGLVSDFAKPFAGRWFREEGLDVDILKALKEKNLLIGKEKYEHSYPFDYRTGSPLMYFPRPAWFIRTTELKDMMIRANREIGWKPEHIRDGRFGNWLENIQDWNVTRERYWGSPLPVWRTEDGSESICFGSIAELADAYQKTHGKPLSSDFDPHKPQIDNIILRTADGREMRRDNFVLDSWFNAGLMPWGQWGYPSEAGSIEQFAAQYPCDFICEGLDQTRGWFYTMLACSCLIAKAKMQEVENSGDEKVKNFWSNPVNWSSYKNCICTELVLDHNGQKMSKSVGNVVDPMELFEKFGADPVRWIFYSSNPWNAKRFGEEEIREGVRSVILPLWNSYSFFVTYALIDNWKPDHSAKIQPTQMDRWILSEYYRLVDEVTVNLDQYEVAPASTAIVRFLDLLTNWYIRRSRRRFWKSESDEDKATAYATLYQVLVGLTHIMAPFLPFLTEFIYQNLVRSFNKNAPESIHLASYPRGDAAKRDKNLETNMESVRTAVTLARSLRQEKNLKVRQPLSSLIWAIPDEGASERLAEFLPIIAEEINVRDVKIIQNDSELVELSATANFKSLGSKVGKKMNVVANAIKQLEINQIHAVEAGEKIKIDEFELSADDIIIKRTEKPGLAIQSDQGMTIALNTTLTPELISEGLARDIVHHVQNLRKEKGFEITDRIKLALKSDSETLRVAIQSYKDYICRETLSLELTVNKILTGTELKTGEHDFTVDVQRIDAPSV
jgi:isoleucyl-tRNA synthetase